MFSSFKTPSQSSEVGTDYLHREFDAGPDDVIEVTLDAPANVQLMDPINFERYRSKKDAYHYLGGYITKSPYCLTPPHQGRWHLVLDLGGGFGRLGGWIRILPAEMAQAGSTT